MTYKVTISDSNGKELASTDIDAYSREDAEALGRNWFYLFHSELSRRTLVVTAMEE